MGVADGAASIPMSLFRGRARPYEDHHVSTGSKPRVTEEHSVCWSQLRDLVQTPTDKVLRSLAVAFLWKIRRLAVHNSLLLISIMFTRKLLRFGELTLS